jgi:hypothetical protein
MGDVLGHYGWSLGALMLWLIVSIWFALSSASRTGVDSWGADA